MKLLVIFPLKYRMFRKRSHTHISFSLTYIRMERCIIISFSGAAMFTMMAENDDEHSLSFGIAKIFEIDGDGNDIEDVSPFDKTL